MTPRCHSLLWALSAAFVAAGCFSASPPSVTPVTSRTAFRPKDPELAKVFEVFSGTSSRRVARYESLSVAAPSLGLKATVDDKSGRVFDALSRLNDPLFLRQELPRQAKKETADFRLDYIEKGGKKISATFSLPVSGPGGYDKIVRGVVRDMASHKPRH